MDPQIDVNVRRISAEDARLNDILNDTAKRVHTVIDHVTNKLAEGRPVPELTAAESQSVLNGAVSGIAAFCSMMRFEVKPGKDATNVTPEDELAKAFSTQFVAAFRFYRDQQQLQGTSVPEKAPDRRKLQ